MDYTSTRTIHSTVIPGARYRISRMSFGRRLELMRELRQLSKRHDFQSAGVNLGDKLDAAVTNAEMDRLYLEWGLEEVYGLTIDGQPCTKALLIDSGPEDLCREIVDQIRRECGLTETERKN